MLSVEANVHDDSSTAQVKYTRAAGGEEVAVSYMQMLLPNLSMGGMGTYSSKSGQIAPSYGFYFDPAEYTLAAQYDNTVRLACCFASCFVRAVLFQCVAPICIAFFQRIMYLPCVYPAVLHTGYMTQLRSFFLCNIVPFGDSFIV
jgi:hypothetical protein